VSVLALLSHPLKTKIDRKTKDLAHLRHNLAKVEVASSSLVSRSKTSRVVIELRGFCGTKNGWFQQNLVSH
jgi:hypothetical protein